MLTCSYSINLPYSFHTFGEFCLYIFEFQDIRFNKPMIKMSQSCNHIPTCMFNKICFHICWPLYSTWKCSLNKMLKILSITSPISVKFDSPCQNGRNTEAWFYNPQVSFLIRFINISFHLLPTLSCCYCCVILSPYLYINTSNMSKLWNHVCTWIYKTRQKKRNHVFGLQVGPLEHAHPSLPKLLAIDPLFEAI